MANLENSGRKVATLKHDVALDHRTRGNREAGLYFGRRYFAGSHAAGLKGLAPCDARADGRQGHRFTWTVSQRWKPRFRTHARTREAWSLGRFDGKLDDVAVFSKALTADEAQTLYHATGMTPPKGPPAPVVYDEKPFDAESLLRYAKAVQQSKPLAYWRLHDSNGPVAQDSTGEMNGRYEPELRTAATRLDRQELYWRTRACQCGGAGEFVQYRVLDAQ